MGDLVFNCPHCTQSLEASEDILGQNVDCPNCGKQIAVPPSRHVPSPAPEVKVRNCPVCTHTIKGNKCMYCGADLSLSKEEILSDSVDLVKGVFVTILDETGKQMLSGMMRAEQDGLHVMGSDTSETGNSGSANLGANLAAGVALFAITGDLGVPNLFGEKQEETTTRFNVVLAKWENIELIDRLNDRIRMTAQNEVKGIIKTGTKTKPFDILLDCILKETEKSHRALYDQIIKYKDPSNIPHCPGCNRVIRDNGKTKRCMYCGATW